MLKSSPAPRFTTTLYRHYATRNVVDKDQLDESDVKLVPIPGQKETGVQKMIEEWKLPYYQTYAQNSSRFLRNWKSDFVVFKITQNRVVLSLTLKVI